jgi:hypothetical protein
VDAVSRSELAWGDSILVRTRNSTYWLTAAEEGVYFVSGGWFDQRNEAPARVRVNGCTWGGSTIHEEILAAPGLFLEFANGVTTTRIQQVLRLPTAIASAAN